MNPRRYQFRPQLETLEDRLCLSSTVVLPISAFLSQQGMTTTFAPPAPDQLGWSNTNDPGAADPSRFTLVDYTGLAAQYLLKNYGIDLHTKVTGFVTETPFGTSGRMEVSVDLEATNALTWVANVANDPTQSNINTDPLELGYRVQDLVANRNLRPALSDVHFQLTFQEQAGAPIPDLVQALILGSPPPDFMPEVVDFQAWGTGTLGVGTAVGKQGQSAFFRTSQLANFTNPPPNTLSDGFIQEPIDLVPGASSVAALNGTLFITDLSNGNDNIKVTPRAGGGVTVSSNLGSGAFASVNAVVVSLGGGNNNVAIASLPGASVNVAALDGNNNISIGNEAETVVSVGGGNNNIQTGNTTPDDQFIFVGGNGNNNIRATNASAAVVLVAGNGNNNIDAAGAGDFIELLGNGNNNITDTGTNDLIWLGGDGNNNIDNQGDGSFTDILAGTGHNHIRGHFGTPGGGGGGGGAS